MRGYFHGHFSPIAWSKLNFTSSSKIIILKIPKTSMKTALCQQNGRSLSPTISIEVSPCSTREKTLSLIERLNCFECKPTLIGVSFHHQEYYMEFAQELVAHGFEVMLHIAGGTLKKNDLLKILVSAQDIGVSHILAVRGDKVNDGTDFPHAADVVRFIRKETGDYFTIAVGGYPNVHPEAISPEKDIIYLKEKVDCGANFIISQFFFSSSDFINFVARCRKEGINTPIIPGILLIEDHRILHMYSQLCQITIPLHVKTEIAAMKEDWEAFENWSTDFATKTVLEIFEARASNTAHFFTFNQMSKMQEIQKRLHVVDEEQTSKECVLSPSLANFSASVERSTLED